VKLPSPGDFDAWERLIGDGREPSIAARELGFLGSSSFRRVDPERHARVLAVSREVREGIANERGEQWAVEGDAPPALRIAYLRAESPLYRQGERVEVAHGGAVVVRHAQRLTLGDLAAFVETLDRPADASALPGARLVVIDEDSDEAQASL
jgi:hypothetical protein